MTEVFFALLVACQCTICAATARVQTHACKHHAVCLVAAEAEQAAAAAAAMARDRPEESASQSQTQEQPAAKRLCRKQSSFHSHSTPQGHSVQPSPVAECVLPSQRREHANFSAREHTAPKQGELHSHFLV